MFHLRTFTTTSTLLSTLLLIPACAATQLPPQQLMSTQGSIDSAEEIGAEENPKAKLHLQFAREQIAAAKQLVLDGDGQEAARMLDRATADADLALTLARTEQLRQESGEARDEVEALRNDDGPAAPPISTNASVQ